MKIFFIRHGQSIGNTKLGFISGRSDFDGLTKKGRIQAIRTAFELRKEKINSIYSSPVYRARETAVILNIQFQTKIQTLDWLTELHHGVFEGVYWWEVIHKIPSEWRKHREDFHSVYPDGGESIELLMHRVWTGLQNFVSTHAKNKIYIFVSHEAVITALRYCIAFGDPKKITTKKYKKQASEFYHKTKLPNAGFVEVEIDDIKTTIIREVRDLPHVEERKENIQVYSKALIGASHITAVKIKTASKNSVYHLKNEKDYLLKILYSKDQKVLDRQVALYSYLAKKAIQAPNIKFRDSSRIFYKTDVLIQDYATGVSQEVCLNEHPQKVNKLLKLVYQEISLIHKIPVFDVQSFWISSIDERFRMWKPYMIFNINMTLYMLKELGFEDEKWTIITNSFKQLKTYILKGKYILCPIHGDLAPGNIIVDHKKTGCLFSRIVDFEWARIGDPLWDMAYYWGWLERANEKVADQWFSLLTLKLKTSHLKIILLYRILFHAWTVRDMFEYEGDKIRRERGERSKEILENSI